MKRSLALAVLAVLIVAAFFWSTRSTIPGPAAPPVVPSAPEQVLLATDAAPADATARTEVPAADLAQALTTLRGRCVDAGGAPIADVTAELSSRPTTKSRMEAWCAQHAPPEPVAAMRTTGADGVFEFRFFPPPPFQFSLGLAKAGWGPESKHWPELEPGATKDLGDVRMTPGTILRGRVVDSGGMPVANVGVQFRHLARLRSSDGSRLQDTGYAQGDGSFVGHWPLVAGDYSVAVAHREVVSPTQVTITGDLVEQVVNVVLAPIDLAATLSGVVVDDEGAPVQRVRVLHVPPPIGPGQMVSTNAEGRFRVTRPKEGGADEVALWLEHPGFEALRSETFAWGRQDLRLVLRRGLEVEVAVVAHAGTGLGPYAVRVLPRHGAFGSDYDIRARGAGTQTPVVVSGVRRGSYFVVVDPTGDDLARSAFVPVEVVGPGRTRVTVMLDPVARRTIRVQRGDGAALAGATVQLVDPMGVAGKLPTLPLERWGELAGNRALQLQVVVTDARGEVVVRGPAGRVLAVFLPGPRHAPTWVPDVRLDVAGPLFVTVAAGGRVTGTVGPLELIGEWRLGAGLSVFGPLAESHRSSAPTVVLRGVADEASEQHPARPVLLDEFGGFEIEDVAAGAWRLVASRTRASDRGPSIRESIATEVVEVRSGETTRVEVDLSHQLPGDLEGLVLNNGAPMAEANVQLISTVGKDATGAGGTLTESAHTDAAGRFQTRVRPGEYSLTAVPARGEWALRASGRVVVTRAQRATQTFHVQSGSVRVRVLDPRGVAVAKVTVELYDAAGIVRVWLPPTGVDGWTTGDVDAEAFTACVLPRRLQSQEARQEVWRANPPGNPDPFAPLRLRLGSVTARVGETTTVELRLPPEFEK